MAGGRRSGEGTPVNKCSGLSPLPGGERGKISAKLDSVDVRSVLRPFQAHRSFSVVSAASASTTEMIQNRTTTVASAQPFCSKW